MTLKHTIPSPPSVTVAITLFFVLQLFFLSLVYFYPESLPERHMVLLIGTLFNMALFTQALLTLKRHNEEEDHVVLILILYFAVGYLYKYIYVIYNPEDLWFSNKMMFPQEIIANSYLPFFVSFIGATSFLFGITLFYTYSKKSRETILLPQKRALRTKDGLITLTIAAFILLSLKYLLQTRYSIGVPGLVPQTLSIPFLTGILSFLVGNALFTMINISLYYSFLSSSLIVRFFTILSVGGYLFLDLRVGYKSGIIYEVVIIGLYGYYLKARLSKIQIKFIIIAITLLLTLISVGYKYVNNYRWASLSGLDTQASIMNAVNSSAVTKSFSKEIYNRINGYDTVLIGLYSMKGTITENINPFDNSITKAFKRKIYGRNNVISAFGLTQITTFYLIGGYLTLIIGMICLSVTMLSTLRIIKSYIISDDKILTKAVYPIISILYAKILFSGGGLSLTAKELLIILLLIKTITFVQRVSFART